MKAVDGGRSAVLSEQCRQDFEKRGRALKRHTLQCWQVKRDAEKGLPIQSQSTQVGIVEVHAEKGTAFKGGFAQVGIVEVDISQRDADEVCSDQPRLAELGAHKDGF